MTDTVPMREKGLGYHWVYDPRAAMYRMADVVDPEAYEAGGPILYERGPILDQGREGACVAFGHGAVVNAGPHKPERFLNNADCQRYYERARQIDEWPGEDYDGTSNQAGAKAYKEAGYYEAFVWAANPTEMRAYLYDVGPVTFTCKWRTGMYRTDRDGYLNVSGNVVGGHLMAIIGILGSGDYVVQNSWGEDFGKGGVCYVRPQVMNALYSEGHWTSCAPTEKKLVRPEPIDPRPEPNERPMKKIHVGPLQRLASPVPEPLHVLKRRKGKDETHGFIYPTRR